MNCKACQIEIEELEIEEGLSGLARAHIDACAACRAFHDERQSLRRLVGSLEPVSAPPDFEFRLRSRLAAGGNGRGRGFPLSSSLASGPAIALAASFALLVAGVIIYKQMKSGTATNQLTIASSNSAEPKVETANTNSAPTAETTAPERKEQNPPASVQVASKETENRLTVRNKDTVRSRQRQGNSINLPIVSNDIGVRSAPQIKQGVRNPLTAVQDQLVELPVRPVSQPVRVSLGDESGAKRTVTLQPVIFGSQDLTGRNLSRAVSSQGIW
ncbi:MAG: hypothetical protein M3362_07030 [Acidobacteriota bacterium]|nr:hypothetical protein [Acidobacteriota bacterium]